MERTDRYSPLFSVDTRNGDKRIPQPVEGWSDLAVFIPQWQRQQLVKKNIAPLVDSYRAFRLWPEQLAEWLLNPLCFFAAG